MSMWVGNCINKRLNCSGGDLGNGKQMKQFSGFSWTANPRLVALPNAPAPTTTKTLVSEGDSISVFWGGNHTGVYARTRPEITFHGLAVGGSRITRLAERASGVTDKNPQVLTVLIGANDLAAYASPQAFLNDLYAYTDPMRARGIKVAVGTILPQYHPTNALFQAKFDSYRATVNASLRASTKVDAVIDFAADPVMGPDAAARNTALYHDGVHPTNACGMGCGGQGKLAVVYKGVVDRLFGL
jgi:lysophospholipase L1-like esterase